MPTEPPKEPTDLPNLPADLPKEPRRTVREGSLIKHARDRTNALAHERRFKPGRVVLGSFLVLILSGAALLKLPFMTTSGHGAPSEVALFTATSAATVTGLATVDTGTYWSFPGQVTILALIQIGGIGIVTLGTLVLSVVGRRMGLATRMATGTEGGIGLGDVSRIVRGIAIISLTAEAVVFCILALRLHLAYGLSGREAAWQALFHSVSAWNNAGLTLRSDSLIGLAGDPWILLPLGGAILIGGFGYPVLLELWERRKSRRRTGRRGVQRLSLHTRLTLIGSAVLVLGGWLLVYIAEFRNEATLGLYPHGQRILVALFTGGITPRTAGFNAIDYAEANPQTRLITDFLMFVGSGSASTGGGIKITTMCVLALAVMAELRGRRDVVASDRRIPSVTVRLAVAVTLLYATAVSIGTLVLMTLDQVSLDYALFEVTSAVGTVGLSANLTPDLSRPALWLLNFLMLLGRVGPLTLFGALMLREDNVAYRLPESRPMIG